MKTAVLRNIVLGVLVGTAMSATAAFAANATITLNAADPYIGYMNVSDLPSAGGAFEFGSSWGTADLSAVFTGANLTLTPNSIGDPNPYWYTPSGGPGATGNKIMEANMYVETTGPLANTNVTFTAYVLSNTLTSAHVAKAFIRDFAPDYSSVVEQSVVLPTSGNFSIALTTINDPARHVQYGFQVKGPDVWATDLAPFGSVVIAPMSATPTVKSTWGKLKAEYR